MAGYANDSIHLMQKRMIKALEGIPGVESVGLVNNYPPLVYGSATRINVFKEEASDFRPSNAAGTPFKYEISPQYFQAAGTALLAGREFTWHDDKEAPAVAVVNREFAGNMFGSVTNALGRHYKLQDGTRVQVVGVVEKRQISDSDRREPTSDLPFVPPIARQPVISPTALQT